MKAIKLIAALCLLTGTAGTAQAQNFTFEATANPATTVGGPDRAGNLAVGATWTGKSTVTWADGKKSVDNYTCVSTTQPHHGKIFDMHTICDGTGSNGLYSSTWGCNWTSKDKASMGCVGGLVGRTGMYAGKGGTITFMGRSGTGAGTGTWGPAQPAN